MNSLQYFIHEKAICDSENIGKETKIWAFAHILKGAKIGSNCNICDHVFIENDVEVGNNCTIKCGVQLWDGIRLKDNVFIGPNVTFTNDIFPRSKKYPEKFLETIVFEGASIGANATILPGIKIGKNAMVGAGCVVVKDVPPNAIVVGNPGTIKGYNSTKDLENSEKKLQNSFNLKPYEKIDLNIKEAFVIGMPNFADMRGSLVVSDFDNKIIPFAPKRIFFVYDVPNKDVRGQHAHYQCNQFLICLSGEVRVLLDDGHNRCDIVLDSAKVGLYMPAMVWGTQYKYSKNSCLCVLASHNYDSSDYIREYDEFISAI